MSRPALSRRFAVAGRAACALAAAAAAGAAAEEPVWRDGQPAVLAVPAPAMDDGGAALLARFGAAWRAAGAPRLALLWERPFDDRLGEFQADVRLAVTREELSRETETGADGERRAESGTAGETVLRLETRRDSARSSPLAESDRFRMEAGFSRAFLEAGATLVDRAAVMRILHAKRAAGDPSGRIDNRQRVETEALRAHADMILEVSAVAGPDAGPDGAVFRVSAVDLRTGALAAALATDAGGLVRRSAGEGEWLAAPGGYVFARETNDADPEENGRVLALRTMEELLRAWR